MQLESFAGPSSRLLRRVLHFYWRFARGLTLGVRGTCHRRGWPRVPGQAQLRRRLAFAGRRCRAGETLSTALARELREEGNIELAAPPILFGVYFNRRVSRRDHVALYVVRSFHQSAPPQPNNEIVAHGFFSPGSLPEDTTRATRARIAEVLEGRVAAEIW